MIALGRTCTFPPPWSSDRTRRGWGDILLPDFPSSRAPFPLSFPPSLGVPLSRRCVWKSFKLHSGVPYPKVYSLFLPFYFPSNRVRWRSPRSSFFRRLVVFAFLELPPNLFFSPSLVLRHQLPDSTATFTLYRVPAFNVPKSFSILLSRVASPPAFHFS